MISLHDEVTDFLAATFFIPSITTEELRSAYNGTLFSHDKLKILIIPGHEPTSGGTEYGGVKERDVVVSIAEKLRDKLEQDGHYDVYVSRDIKAWNDPFRTYFTKERQAIINWRKMHELTMNNLVDAGFVSVNQAYVHGTAVLDDAVRMYGVQRWANENNIDVLLHLHINDYPRKGKEKKYTGLAIYVPEEQYSNSSASSQLEWAIFSELNKVIATSTLKEEKSGVIPDQELIAIGRFNTADTANILIEYGYIYEPQYQNKMKRLKAVDEYALRTYLGLESFFNATTSPNFD